MQRSLKFNCGHGSITDSFSSIATTDVLSRKPWLQLKYPNMREYAYKHTTNVELATRPHFTFIELYDIGQNKAYFLLFPVSYLQILAETKCKKLN